METEIAFFIKYVAGQALETNPAGKIKKTTHDEKQDCKY